MVISRFYKEKDKIPCESHGIPTESQRNKNSKRLKKRTFTNVKSSFLVFYSELRR